MDNQQERDFGDGLFCGTFPQDLVSALAVCDSARAKFGAVEAMMEDLSRRAAPVLFAYLHHSTRCFEDSLRDALVLACKSRDERQEAVNVTMANARMSVRR